MAYEHVFFGTNYDVAKAYSETDELPLPDAAFLSSIALESSYTDRDDKFVHFNDTTIPRLLQNVLGFLYNQKVIENPTDGNRISPFKLYNDNLSDPNAVSFKYEGDRVTYQLKVTSSNRTAIERVLNYSADVLGYLPYSIKGPKEQKNTLYGVELEACSNYSPKEVISAQKALFFILKQDGSISGSKPQKYEMVTVPATLKAHKRLWAEFFSAIDYEKFDTTKDTGNGMHVHIDRTAFKAAGHLNRFTWFLLNPSHTEFIYTVSERPSKANLNQWAPLPNFSGYSKKHHASMAAIEANRGIRGTVNFKGVKTVEVRMFKGIVSYATIVKNIEFVDSVVEYTRETSLSQLSLRGYTAWLRGLNKNRYQTLRLYLSEIKLDLLATGAYVDDYLWHTTNVDAVFKKLLSAPFPLTNDIVTAINKKRRKRTFTLKNGVLTCLVNTGGLLSKLDKSVQQKQLASDKSFAFSSI